MNKPLTKRQKNVLSYITKQIQQKGIPPTIREIGAHFSLSIGAIQDHLKNLEKKGVLKKTKERARALMVSVKKDINEKIRLPILGSVKAGIPIEAISNVEDYLSVDEAIAKQANFVLRVKGDSMEPELHENDMVLVKITETARNGDVVVAYTQDHEATVKKFRSNGRQIYLEASNPEYPPIKKDFSIAGKVTSLIRTYF